MGKTMQCPNCGETQFDLYEYDSMMVVRPEVALFTLHCPNCEMPVSALVNIPSDMLDEVRCAAVEIGAGMGCDQAI